MAAMNGWWQRFYQQVLIPRAGDIAEILGTPNERGETVRIACAVFEPEDLEAPLPFGWDGQASVFEMPPAAAERFAGMLQILSPKDPAAKWLCTPRFGRIFLFVQSGTLCINFDAGRGYSVAPGTLDHEHRDQPS